MKARDEWVRGYVDGFTAYQALAEGKKTLESDYPITCEKEDEANKSIFYVLMITLFGVLCFWLGYFWATVL